MTKRSSSRSCGVLWQQFRTWALIYLTFLLGLSSGQLSDSERTPRITKQIALLGSSAASSSLEFAVGYNSYLQIEAQGTSPLQYVWYKDDSVTQNDTSTSYIISNAQESDSGAYRCFVNNKLGTVRSRQLHYTIKAVGQWSSDDPSITVSVEEGNSILLVMPQISYVAKEVLINWQQNEQDITDGLNVYISESYDLVLLNIPLSYNGYRFRVKLQHLLTTGYVLTHSHDYVLGVSASQSSSLPPKFEIFPNNVEAVEGSDAKLECVVNGQPFNNLQIVWFKGDDPNRSPIPSDNRLTISANNRLLTISAVTSADAGIYGCEGKINGQDGSTVTHQATLTVLVPPKISNPPEALIIKDFQESLVLDCEANGNPDPDVQWYFNGALLSSAAGDDNRYVILPNKTLTIQSVDLPDSGVYQCFAVNSGGETDSYTELFVNSAPPTVTEAPVNITVAEHENTGFKCVVSGGPRPQVYWTKDGVNLTDGGRIRITEQELLISDASLGDSGLYTCHAVNIKGSVSAQAKLTVVIKTKIIQPPQNVSRIISTYTEMVCGVRSDESVTVTWTWYFTPSYSSQAEEIKEAPNNKEIRGDGTLVLFSVIGPDSGTYECVVTSEGGNDRSKATLNVIELPSAPQITSVALIADVPNSVELKWTQDYDGHTPILKFIIQSKLESFSTGSGTEYDWETVNSNVDPSLRSYIVEGLLPSKYYRFRMIAVNEVNESEPSAVAPEETEEALKMPAQPPSEAPKNLYCVQGDEREIKVMWDPPPTSSWNGDLEGYKIYYEVSSIGEETQREVDVPGADTRQETIGYLAYNTKYRVFMAAYNEKGPGVKSSDYYVTTLQGTPAAPPSNVTLASPNSTTIKVEWDPPDPRVLNGINQGYDIDVYEGDRLLKIEDVRFDDRNPTGRQTHYLVNLKKFTNYTLQIACKTAPGPGPKSNPQSIRTLEDVPGQVNNLRIVSISEQNMFFTWEPPIEANGIITAYRIISQKKDGSSPASTAETGSDATSYSLLGLAYQTIYVVSVEAKTSVGYGLPVSTEFSSAEPPQQPGPPTQLAWTNPEARSVLLQFRPGFDGKATITLWIVEALIEDSTTWVEVFSISDPTADEIKVENLSPYTYYQLRIIAQNVFSKSEPSEPCSRFQTKQDVPGAAPEEVTPRAVSATEIRVRWRQIARTEWNGDYLGYKILYRRWSTDFDLNTTSASNLALVQEENWSMVTLRNGSDIQEFTLTGLEEWMQYEVKMKAYNGAGDGAESLLTSERTLEGVPSASPTNIEPQALAPTSIKVTWSEVPILQQNGNIKGYKVKYVARGSEEEAQYLEVDGVDTMEATLTELRMFVEYDIQVLAFSRIGDGALSTSVTIRTLAGPPGPPVNIWFPDVTESAVTIVWDPPDEPNGVILMYQVDWKRADQTDSNTQQNSVDIAVTAPLRHEVTGLDGETTYTFSVTARTQDKMGETATVDVYTIATRDRPSPPYNLRVGTSEIMARSMTIFWSEGDNNYGPIRNHTIQHRKRGDADWHTVKDKIGPDITSYVVEGLQPNSFYSFRVAATNDIGMSDYSNPSTEMQTLQDKPDGAPQNVVIVALERTVIKISWEAPELSLWNSEFLMGYRVRMRIEREGTVASSASEEDEEGWMYDFVNNLEWVRVGLEPGLKYLCNVQAHNFLGGGPWSTGAFTYLEIAPFDPPQDLEVINKSATELLVTWTAPPPGTTNGDLIGYKVIFWHAPNDSCLEDEVNAQQRSATETQIVLDHLSPYTMYCSTVQALNIAGEGPPTLPKGHRTSEDLPSKPSDLQFKNITLQELMVLWEPPASPNGHILKYQLQYFVSLDNQESFISTHTLSGTDRQFYVTDLLENQNYTFQLSAYTSIGRGTIAEKSLITGPQAGSPEAPSQPTVERQDQYLLMTWVNGAAGQSQIYAYHIRYREQQLRRKRQDSGDDWVPLMEVNNAMPEARINLNDLKPSTNYTFRVRAINEQGISHPSPATGVYKTPASLVARSSKPFHTEWWFLVIVALTGVIFILLIITLLCYVEKRRNKGNELKRSVTATTVMSTPEPEDGGFPSLEMRQSRRSLARNGKVHNNIYARSPPRPSPASVTYSEDIPPPIAGAAAAAIKPPLSEDNSSVLSDKPSNLGDSSDEETTDSDSSDNSIAKAPVPSSPPPPAFSSHFSRSGASNSSSGGHRHRNHHYNSDNNTQSTFPQHPNSRSFRSNRRSAFNPGIGMSGPHSNSSSSPTTPTADLGDGGAVAGASGGGDHRNSAPSWRFQKPSNAYTYTDSEAESSHYAFSLNNGNIVVNNVAGARTPLAGFSSFV